MIGPVLFVATVAFIGCVLLVIHQQGPARAPFSVGAIFLAAAAAWLAAVARYRQEYRNVMEHAPAASHPARGGGGMNKAEMIGVVDSLRRFIEDELETRKRSYLPDGSEYIDHAEKALKLAISIGEQLSEDAQSDCAQATAIRCLEIAAQPGVTWGGFGRQVTEEFILKGKV